MPSAQLGRAGLGLDGFLVAAFVLLVFSRLSDISVLAGLRLPFVVAVAALAVGARRFPRVLSSKPGVLFVALTAWFAVSTLFSVWRGGSVQLLRDKWMDSLLVFVLTATLIHTARGARAVGRALAASGVVIVGLVTLLGQTDVDGRLVMPAGTLANSNYLAMHLLMALPFIVLPAHEPGKTAASRAVGWGLGLLTLGFLLGTGSRGTVVALGVMLLATFSLTTWRGRAGVVIGAAVACIVIAIAIPEAITDRLATTWGGGAQMEDVEGFERAVTSTQARRALLASSIALTLRNPVTGVGPGMFPVAENERARAAGGEGAWHETHNTYTQLSSEAGIPAALLYLGLMTWCWTTVNRVRATCRGRQGTGIGTATAVQVCLVGYAVVGVFSSLAYDLYFPALVGYSYGLGQAFLDVEVTKPAVLAPAAR